MGRFPNLVNHSLAAQIGRRRESVIMSKAGKPVAAPMQPRTGLNLNDLGKFTLSAAQQATGNTLGI